MDIFDSTPPILSTLNTTDNLDYITVVSIGSNDSPKIEHTSKQKDCKDYITVLKIGTNDQNFESTTEEVLVYRLPGEKLGFGLKFEGGTKSAEFVRRLFIQSCAVNSPASRVECSWGSLVEGDEVLEIDSVPVNTMTRTDCVRCLKDSNVVIKLLIRHRFEDTNSETNSDESHTSRSVEDLPFVISAEKKRSPPPPPPVPPRKVNRKSKENIANIMIPPKGFGDSSGDANSTKQNHEISQANIKNHRLQSPYNSFRKQRQSPEVIKRAQRSLDDLNCPPDAEVYIDLISQESAYSLSESDDTGSSISTIVDKLGSFPPTTNSSFAGSVPSTPTPIQRHIYQGDDFDFNSETYLFSKLITSQPNDEDDIPEDLVLAKQTKALEMSTNDGTPLQPPANFQDAPLSYGNEDVKIVKSELRINLEVPSPPPRSKSQSIDVVDAPELPRLVDFVPKSSPPSNIDLVREFLENEKCNFDYITIDNNKNHIKNFELELDNMSDDNSWGEESDFFSLDWSPSSKLATIGEDEEDTIHENECQPVKNETPIVIIENADAADESCEKCVKEQDDDNYREERGVEEKTAKEVPILSTSVVSIPSLTRGIDVDEIMEGPRQPPDGHEFPDQEKTIENKMPIIDTPIADSKTPPTKRESWMSKYEPQANSVRDKIAIFSNPRTTLNKKYVSTSSISTDSLVSRREKNDSRPTPSLYRHNSVIESKPRYRTTANITPDYPIQISQSNYQPVTLRNKPDVSSRLHSRSMSLLDISDNTNKFDRWNQLIEQRSLSKLKGLVIPENEPETDGAPFVDLPEIKSIMTPVIERTYKENNAITVPKLTRRHSTSMSSIQTPPPRDPPSIPKYSPAFKRRSFQIHTPAVPTTDQIKIETIETKKVTAPPVKTRDFSNFTISTLPNDPPKSLESITSPTRSDYSFEFNNGGQLKSPIGEIKLASSREKLATPRSNSCVSDIVPSSEYDSDTDSALSSSQSSYLSKTSPPASPIHSRSDSITDVHKKSVPYQDYETVNKRLLKPQSLEAINRKNILASARCRSGRDLKIGSPLIQRKFDDNEANIEEQKPLPNGNAEPKLTSVEIQPPKESPVVEDKKEPAPKVEEPPTPKARRENPITPKIVLKDTKNIFPEVLFEGNKRNTAGTCYYKANNLVVRKASSVTDLRKNFEKVAPTPAKRNSINCIVMTPVQPRPIKRTSLPQIIPLANAVKTEEPEIKPKIKPTLNITKDEGPRNDYDKLIDDAIKNNDEAISKFDVKVVILKPDVDGGSIGITLAGGADYEIKEITIHKIRDGSPAYRDGRLQKGDRVLAINGKYMKDLSHSQARRVLKENVQEVIIIACKGNESNIVTTPKIFTKHASLDSLIDLKTTKDNTTPEPGIDVIDGVFEVSIVKDATGLGFSIQGGRGSPQGDVPLIIKKIFMGGAAEKAINLRAGDNLLEINGIDVTSMSRMEAWNLMKRLPEQEVIMKVRR